MTSSATPADTTTLIEATSHSPISTSYTEINTDSSTSVLTGNFLSGNYTRDYTDTFNATDNDTFVSGTTTVVVSETSAETTTGEKHGNAFTGDYSQTESADGTYTMSEAITVPGTGGLHGTPATTQSILETGSLSLTTAETGNVLSGLYSRTQHANDSYTLSEAGTLPGGGDYTETVIGTDTPSLVESGNSANQYYTRTVTGGGSYTLSETGGTETPGTFTNSYTLTESSNDRSGGLSQTETGTDRYGLLERYVDVANTYSGNQPGNMDFLPFGRPFVDPDFGSSLKAVSGAVIAQAGKNDPGWDFWAKQPVVGLNPKYESGRHAGFPDIIGSLDSRFALKGSLPQVDPYFAITPEEMSGKLAPQNAPFKADKFGNAVISPADLARINIRINLLSLKQNIVTEVFLMLKKTPPDNPALPETISDKDLIKAANDIADTYIRAVDTFLKEHPGARPELGTRSAWKDLLGLSNEKNAPWCADWAPVMTSAMLELGSKYIGASHGQYHEPGGVFYVWDLQHNFLIVRPFGYKAKFLPDLDPVILMFDPWRDLMPRVYHPSQTENRMYAPTRYLGQ